MSKKVNKLSDVDIEIIQQFCTVGVTAFYDEGYSANQILKFMKRPEVQEAIAVFISDYNSQEALLSLTRFNVTRNLSKMAVDALTVIKQALEGPTYETRIDDDGDEVYVQNLMTGMPKIADPEPTPLQMVAAKETLDRLGIVKPVRSESTLHENVSGLLADQQKPVFVLEDKTNATEEQKVLAREKVRNTILHLTESNAVGNAIKQVKKTARRKKRNTVS